MYTLSVLLYAKYKSIHLVSSQIMKGQEALMDITPKGYDKAAELFVARVTTEAASDAVY